MPKNILITGAAGNLGSVITNHFLDQGHQVIGTHLGEKKPESKADFYECDLADEKATDALFKTLKGSYEKLDAALLLAGGFGMGSIENTSSEDILNMFHLNFLTAYHAAQNAFTWMSQSSDGGKIIMVGAKPALEEGGAAVLPYAISKNAVIKLAEILNEAGVDKNIHASVIVPSVIDTPPNRKLMSDADFDDWVKPAEIANAFGFLVSDDASALRKTILRLYGNS